MSLIVNNVISATGSISYSYLETNFVFGYELEAVYKVDVSDVSFTDEDGVLWEAQEALRQAYLRKDLVGRIGLDEFTNGRIQSINFSESSLTGSVEATITIQQSNRVESEFDLDIPALHLIDSFTENFNFSRNEENYTFNRNATIKYKKVAQGEFLNYIRFFVDEIYFKSRPNYGFHTDGISEELRFDGGYRPLLTEEIDVFDLSCSITEEFVSSKKVDETYSKKVSSIKEINKEGYTNKQYSIEVRAIKDPLEINLRNGIKETINNTISQETLLNAHSIEKNINKDGGVATINISLSNDPRLKDKFTSYTLSQQKREAYIDYTIVCEHSASGKDVEEKYNNVKTLWGDFQGLIQDKLSFFYPSSGNLYEKSRSTNINKKEGKINETLVFTDETSYDSPSIGIMKFQTTQTVKDQKERYSLYFDLQDLTDRVYTNDLLSLIEGTFNLNCVAFKSLGIFFGSDFLKTQTPSSIAINNDSITTNSANGTSSRVINYASIS